jgi:hypothetical protein
MDEGRPPYSIAAAGGFIIALLFLLPIVPFMMAKQSDDPAWLQAGLLGAGFGLLAVVLGIVGIVRTSFRRRRGRGLAVAAIPIGLLAVAVELVFGVGFHYSAEVLQQHKAAVAILDVPLSRLSEEIPEWYSSVPSSAFTAEVTEADLKEWIEGVVEEHGQLQDVSPPERAQGSQGVLAVRATGRFVNGAAEIEVKMRIEGVNARVDDILVDGSSPRN